MLKEYERLVELSKLPHKQKYLNYYLVGFADAEGCFNVSLKKEPTTKFGWALDPVFHVTQHKDHSNILYLFQKTLKCGRVVTKSGQENLMQFMVDNRRQLTEKIIPFFDKHKLMVKDKDFELFKQIIQGLESKLHSNEETFKGLIKKAFEMNYNGKQRRYSLEEVYNGFKTKTIS